MKEEWIIKIVDKGYTFYRDVFLYRRVPNGTEIYRGDTTEIVDEGAAIVKPSFILSPEMLQSFADALNEQGYKPQKGFIEGKLQATEKHLEDMRTLVFKKPNTK